MKYLPTNTNSPRIAEIVKCIAKNYKLKIVHEYAPTTVLRITQTASTTIWVQFIRETKLLHHSEGRLKCACTERNKPYGNDNR